MPGNVCNSLISLKGKKVLKKFLKKSKKKESSVLYVYNEEVSIKKWQLLEWERHCQEFSEVPVLVRAQKAFVSKRRAGCESFLGNVRLFHSIKYLLEGMSASKCLSSRCLKGSARPLSCCVLCYLCVCASLSLLFLKLCLFVSINLCCTRALMNKKLHAVLHELENPLFSQLS